MIPELLVTFLYSCIAGGIIGGGILLIKVYFPKYDIFKIEYFSRKGIENNPPRKKINNELALYNGIKKDDDKLDYMYTRQWFNSEPKRSFYYSQKIDHFNTIDRVVYPASKNALAIVPRQTHNNTLALVILPTVLLFTVLMLIVLKRNLSKKKNSISIGDKHTKPCTNHEEHETKIIGKANKCKNDESQSLARLEASEKTVYIKQHTTFSDGSLLPKDQLQITLGNKVDSCLDVEASKIDHTRTDGVVVKDSHVMPSEQLHIVFDNVKRRWSVEVKKVEFTSAPVVVKDGSLLQPHIDLENVNPCLDLEGKKVDRTDESVAVKDGSLLPSKQLHIVLDTVKPCLDLEGKDKMERTDESVTVKDGSRLSSEQLQIVFDNVKRRWSVEVKKVEFTSELDAVKDGSLLPSEQPHIDYDNVKDKPSNENCTVNHKKQSQRKHHTQRKTEKRNKDRNKGIKFIKEKPTPKLKPESMVKTPKQISDLHILNNDSSRPDRAHEESVCTSLRQQAIPSQKGVPLSLQNEQELTNEHQEHRPLPSETPNSLHLSKLTTATATCNKQTASKHLNVPSSTVSLDKVAQLESIKPASVTRAVPPDRKSAKSVPSSPWTKLRPHGRPEKRVSSTENYTKEPEAATTMRQSDKRAILESKVTTQISSTPRKPENGVKESKDTLPCLQQNKHLESKVKHLKFRPYIHAKVLKGTLPLLRRDKHEQADKVSALTTNRRESNNIKTSKVYSVKTSALKLNIQEEREETNATKNCSTLPPVFPAQFNWKMDKYPVWGGVTFMNPHGSITMTNTCPIDGWILILHSLYQGNGLIRKRLNDGDCKFFQQLEMFYQAGQFNNIKRNFMTLNNIDVINRSADMFGSEHNCFIKHLHILYGSRQLSRCSSPSCPNSERYLPAETVSWCDPSVSIQKLLVDWMEETSLSNCTESGSHINQKFCDGVRVLHRRRFERDASHPLMIPINAEMLFYTGYVISVKSIPKLVEVVGRKYGLKSVTFVSKSEEHFVCVVRHRGTWLMYDGRQNRGRPVLFTGNQVRKSYIVSTILYELL